jgi:ABC-type uncharacterized transport system YnjBCD permease subunit
MQQRRLAIAALASSIAMAVVTLVLTAKIASQPCQNTMCFDWGTSSPTERMPGATGGLMYGLLGAVFLAPFFLLVVLVLVGVPAWIVSGKSRRDGTDTVAVHAD